jgi:hypothetical protein
MFHVEQCRPDFSAASSASAIRQRHGWPKARFFRTKAQRHKGAITRKTGAAFPLETRMKPLRGILGAFVPLCETNSFFCS